MTKLMPKMPLGGYSREWSKVSLQENYAGELVSLVVPNDGHVEFNTCFKNMYGKTPPKPNCYKPVDKGKIIWTGENQYLALVEGENIHADTMLAIALKNTAYTTLQSDGWASLILNGTKSLDVLERFIPLDLRSASAEFAARTTAHHMAVIVIKSGEEKFQLLTPRSSARSFVSALEHIIQHIEHNI